MRNLMLAPTYTSRRRGDSTRLLVAGSPPRLSTVKDIEAELRPGDVIVLNESGTLPASLPARLERTGEPLELRLAAREDDSAWLAVTFGSGSWRLPTEERGAPPALHAGDLLALTPRLRARVRRLDARHPRLVHLRLEGELADLYRAGSPVQYSYHRDPLSLWDAQTLAAALPWSVEAPSALFPLTAGRLLALRGRHRVVPLLHGAGLSSTGDAALDAHLPLPEPYRIPAATMAAVLGAKRSGGRVLAWGTSAARALESAYETGRLEGSATLRLGPRRPARLVDGLVTGFHEPGTSHFELEAAFAPAERGEEAYRAGRGAGLLGHEYGDLVLVWKETV